MMKVFCHAQAPFIKTVKVGLMALLIGNACAQAPEDAQFDPSDVYFQGYLEVRAAEQLEKDGDFLEALEKYEQAGKLFDAVRMFYPGWKPEMVKNRRELSAKARKDIEGKAWEQKKAQRSIIAELEGGAQVGASPELLKDRQTEIFDFSKNGLGNATKPPALGIFQADPFMMNRLKQEEAELERLRLEQAKSAASANGATQDAEQIKNLQTQNDHLARQIRASEKNIQSLRSQLAAAPVRGEMQSLQNQIQKIEQEKDAMALALKNSRNQHMEALSNAEVLKADIEVMNRQIEDFRQREANFNRDIAKEREVANEVVKGQRFQIDSLQKTLSEKSKQIDAAQEQIGALKNQLKESFDAYESLKNEHNTLLQEREQMASLLKLNESQRIEQLIEQNMGLAKSMREANEKLERLNLENNASKDDMVKAQQDLAIAKSQIIRLRQENREQEKRFEKLSEKLRKEEEVLVKNEANADPAEVEMLREVIRRQLRAQERRRQAKVLLLETAIHLGEQKDQKLKEAIELLNGAEIELSPSEQKMIANQEIDGEFISPFARDHAKADLATAELGLELDSYDRAAKKAFLAGRLHSTRELFELMIEQNPGHIPSLCKLGVVQLKLDAHAEATETFRKAVELDENNPYAYRMLGYSYYMGEDFLAAKESLQKCIALAPDDSKSYVILGTIAFHLGDAKEAEAHFKSAIFADPMPSEPYFNLAMIYSETGRCEEGIKQYQKAMERGAVPDPILEKKLHGQP